MNKPLTTSFRIGRDVIANPKISVIIPAYNISAFIAEALDSVFAQTFEQFEVIVINDGSPDTIEFAKALEPYMEKIVYLKQPNVGAGAARNAGIKEARGELIAFLDGDDVWYPRYLESQIHFLEANPYDLVYCDALLFGGSVYDRKNYMRDAPSEGEANFESLLDLRCNVITSGTIARKQNIMAVGMFEIEKARAHDFVLWLRMAKNGTRIGYQKKILLKYRVRLESLTGDSMQKVQREIDVYRRVMRLMQLNEAQKAIVQKHLFRLNAEIEIEKGKSLMLRKEFDAARAAFEKGNQFRRSNKLRLIVFMLRAAPNFLLKFYKWQRSKEIAFIP